MNFPTINDKADLEEGPILAPRFNDDGLVPAIATDVHTGDVLMLAWMNEEALRLTIETGLAHYYSRSRQKLWKKGESSGHMQKVQDLRVDCDQDAVWMKVDTQGAASCHTGYRSCFFRRVPLGTVGNDMEMAEDKKLFDPNEVYGKKS